MRKKIIAGNWKMNLNYAEAVALVNVLLENQDRFPQNSRVILAPPALYLSEMHNMVKDSKISLSAQNGHQKEGGAFTGEISMSMLMSAGISHCIIGHSERREFFGETDELIGEKVKACLDQAMIPIYCCGEKQEHRLNREHLQVVQDQITNSLFSLGEDEFSRVIIAYEPVWAIGTGLTATSEQAQEMHEQIRYLIARRYGDAIAGNIHILYGGSCKPQNAAELFACPDVDGGLIGGASLKGEDFLKIIAAAE